MHELSIAMSIVDIAREAVEKAGAQAVEHIELEIGQLAGIELQALEFAWSEAVRGSVLAHATKSINHISGEARCMECNTAFPIQAAYDRCPSCTSLFIEVVHGKELRVHALTVH
ncbi:MAG: hydrogenase maturation nickel metallochaperone HypA [Saprospiraceae bacterium]|nr:hydrogenase maturation nickel metallochaperone HypA [Saprospiraceae bacterium]